MSVAASDLGFFVTGAFEGRHARLRRENATECEGKEVGMDGDCPMTRERYGGSNR